MWIFPPPQSQAPMGPSVSPPIAPSLPLQNLSVDKVTTLLGQNVGDLQKARSHPTISSWLRSLNRSALGELGLDIDPTGPAGPTGPTHSTAVVPHTSSWAPHRATTSGRPGNDALTSGIHLAPHVALPLGGPYSASAWPSLPRVPEDPQTATCVQSHTLLANSFSTCLLG